MFSGFMTETPPTSRGPEATGPRDRLLRRLIVIFVLAAAVTFWTAVGVSAWHGPSYRLELARQTTAP